jgi:hypothetical protein
MAESSVAGCSFSEVPVCFRVRELGARRLADASGEDASDESGELDFSWLMGGAEQDRMATGRRAKYPLPAISTVTANSGFFSDR